MTAVYIVTVLALLQFIWFGFETGGARGKAGIKAPQMTGDERFERLNRVHMNTLEQLAAFLPALWMFSTTVNPLWGAYIAIVYLVGRFVYRASYVKDPSGRTVGFLMSFLPTVVMLIWVLVDAVRAYL